MNRKALLLGTIVLASCFSGVSAWAQEGRQRETTLKPTAQPNNVSQASAQKEASQVVTDESADISITATVTAKELLFEVVPNPTVEFPGKHKRDTVWDAERENLPNPVTPGVTYRNIGIRLKIVSRFADIERIVAEALNEVPVTDEVQPPEKTPPQPSTPPAAAPPSPKPTGGSTP